MTATEQPPGWYLDPVPGAPDRQYRYWTGTTWTPNVATPGIAPAPTTWPAAPVRGSRRWIGVVVALAFVVLVGAVGVRALRSGDRYPSAWDPQVAPIAARVSELRGLPFEHPVRVRYLTPAEFRERVGVKSGDLDADARQKVRELAGTLRALGLISAQANLVESFDTANRSSVLAFYNPDDREIVVRGTGPLDAERKATLAHELTHVLQDQHFGLEVMRSAALTSDTSSSGALTALIEGDAERIKGEYLGELSASERREYDAAQVRIGSAIDDETAEVEQIVKIALGAPYAFGPDVLAALTAKGGNGAVDDALSRPAPSDAIYLDPTAAIEDREVVAVRAPKLRDGERRVGEAEELGPFDLYTLLASRVDRQVALDAADSWAGDRMVTYRRRKQTCVRATIASSTRRGAESIAGALDAWSASMPAATISTSAGRRRSTLTSCDTGASSSPDSSKLAGALLLLGGRNGLLASLLEDDIPPAVGECVSRGLAKSKLFVDTLERGNDLSPSEQAEARRLTTDLMRQCGGRVPS